MKLDRKLLFGILIAVLVAGCAAPRPVQPQQATLAATSTRVQRPTRVPEAVATIVASPTAAPTATAQATPSPQPLPTATTLPSGGTAAPANVQAAPTTGGKGSGVLLPLSSRKYPAPALLTPGNNATYHVAQPVVHMAWSATLTDLMPFGQTPGCVSDATNYRRAFESYQLVIHSLDANRADQVQWTENSPEFYFNLTTVPAGHYAWSVSVVTLCESYVAGQRAKTITRSFVGPVSPVSASRVFNWIP
jgi:hypothetical protein